LGTVDTDELEESDSYLKLIIKTSTTNRLELKYPNVNKIGSTILKENNYLKHVYLKVRPANSAPNEHSSPSFHIFSLIQSMLGLYTNIGYDTVENKFKFIVQGFTSTKFLNYQTLKIGDMLFEFNNESVNTENISKLLLSIKPGSIIIKLGFISPITYVDLNLNARLLKKFESSIFKSIQHNKNHLKNRIISNSKSTRIVKGNRIKSGNQNQASELFMFVMILSLSKNTLKKQTSKDKVIT
jgi:hypothetical protein